MDKSTQHIKRITAGAGAGKTHTIVNLVLNHLNSGKGIDTVFVTTFTNDAARELRERITKGLLEHGKATEAAKINQAWIGTVHGLGKRMIDLFTFEAGYAPGQQVIPEDEEEALIGEVMAGSLTDEDYIQLTTLADQLEVINWQDDVLEIIKKVRENNINLSNHEAFANSSIAEFKTLIGDHLCNAGATDKDAVLQVLKSVKDSLVAIEDKKLRAHKKIIGAIEAFIDQFPDNAMPDDKACLDALQSIMTLINKLDKKNKAFQDAKVLFQPCLYYLFNARYNHAFLDVYKNYIHKLFDAAHKTHENYIQFKKQRGLMDFPDQENEFLALLSRDRVAHFVKQTFSLMLVDEFQDTNPMQLAIFMKMAPLIETVVFVGDSRQSIYGFRGTDPLLLQNVEEHTALMDQLNISRRSRESLVHFSNAVFKDRFPLQDGQPYALKPWEELTEDKSFSNALMLWDGGEKCNEEQLRHKVVHQLARLIAEGELKHRDKDTKEIRPTRMGDIAILCQSNANVYKWAAALETRGIPASAETEGFQDQAEVVFMLAALAYLSNEKNTLAIAEMLRLGDEAFSGDGGTLIDDRLKSLSNEETSWMVDHPFMQKLNGLRPNIRHLGVHDLVAEVIILLDLYSFTARWGKAPGRRANLQKILALATEYQQRCLTRSTAYSLQGFLQWIKKRNAINCQPSADKNAVTVLTYHKAKGLEWPVVLMDGLGSEQKNFWWGTRVTSGDAHFDLHNPLAGRGIMHLHNPFKKNAFTGNYAQPDPFLFAHIEQQTFYTHLSNENLKEDSRKLYVGATRARDYLVLLKPIKQEEGWWQRCVHPLWNQVLDTQNDFVVGAENIAVKYTLLGDVSETTSTRTELYYAPLSGKKDREAPLFITPSQQVETLQGAASNLVATCIDKGERLCGGLSENDLGDALHAAFALYHPNHPAKDEVEKIDRLLQGFHLPDAPGAEDVFTRVRNFYQWLHETRKPNEVLTEVPLRVEENGQVLAGTADLIAETHEGYVLVDFKSYQGEDVITHAAKYVGQLNAYRQMIISATGKKVLQAYLYYPVTGMLVSFK